jgi:polysaccharide biosynthesis/export protein
MRTFLCLWALCLSLFLTSCATTGAVDAGAPSMDGLQTQAVDAYKIGVDDQVQVTVWRNPELGITVPVRPDGMISVPLIGDVLAGGKTPPDVAKDIQDKLSAYVRDPQVAVILTELRSHEYLSRVRVTGAVRQPVSVPYRPGMTVLDAVLAAGGVTEFAAPDEVKLDRILSRGDLSTNYPVAPGDVITVPERAF